MSKVVVATYHTHVPFRIPEDIDLNAEGVEWGIKWNTLWIRLPDGRELEVECIYHPETDYKEPNSTSIEPAEDWIMSDE
jgi:hypothetical protein